MTNDGNWNVVIAGECMLSRTFAMHDDSQSMAVIEHLRNSDLTYAHLEMNLGEWSEIEWPAKAEWLGSYMLSDPAIADDLKWAGIDIMSLAHNHSFDFGPSGLMSTIRHCKRAGLAVAGTGCDLEEAREPAYLEKRKGRVALVSASSGNKAFEWAGLPKASLRGRPGVNPQRLNMKYVVPQEAAAQLRAIGEKLGALRLRGRGGTRVDLKEGEFGFVMPGEQSMSAGSGFVAGDKYEIQSFCHPRDLAGNMRSIEEARAMADLVIVARHFNVSEGPRGDTPPKFVQEFAHAAIDAGADIYCGHGWHRTLGIEIYKGKPIFYGLGNFFAQSEFIRRVPYDSYEAWGHDVERLPTLTPAAYPLHPGLNVTSDTWWTSAILRLRIENDQLRQITLHPVDMGREATKDGKILRQTGRGPHAFTEGRPMVAERENARLTLERYQRLSADFGTEIKIKDDVGVIDLQ